MSTQQGDRTRRLSLTESAGLFLVAFGVVAALISGGTPVPLMALGFAVFVVGWMLRRN